MIDQYHLKNSINKTAWVSTIMIKMSEAESHLTLFS